MSSFIVSCPCGCGEPVAAHDAGWGATTITVDACADGREAGIVSREMRKSWGLEHAVVAPSLAHRDGLVAFA